MAERNKAQVQELDVDHELPAGDGQATGAGSPPVAEAAPSELEKLRAERDSLFDRLARQQAEFENLRKRNAREQQEHRAYAVADAARQLLPILDSLDRALSAARKAGESSELVSGVELIRKQMSDALAKIGVEEIHAANQAFDPQWHQAVEVVDTNDAPDHTVIEELQPGYRLKDRLLRPAMVRVARNSNNPKAN